MIQGEGGGHGGRLIRIASAVAAIALALAPAGAEAAQAPVALPPFAGTGLKFTPVGPVAESRAQPPFRAAAGDTSSPSAAGAQVEAEGPTAGPVGLKIPFSTPACRTSNGNQAVLVVYVDYEEVGYYHGPGLNETVYGSYWTMGTPGEELGAHQLSFACVDGGSPDGEILLFIYHWESDAIWKDDGFSFDNTGPARPTVLSAGHSGPGRLLTTPTGAPAGPTACPVVDATPWRVARIAFYSWTKDEWLYPEERFTLADPAVAELAELPFQVPRSAKQGELLSVVVECDRPAQAPRADEPGFVYLSSYLQLDMPAGGPLTARELAAGGRNPSESCLGCFIGRYMSFGRPVDAATGNFWHSFTDFDLPGLGPALDLTRTYNSVAAGEDGPFGHGWSSTYGMALAFPDATHVVVNQENGAQVTFTEAEDGTYGAPPRVAATLVHNGNGNWSLLRRQRDSFVFDSAGRLTRESALEGNVTSLTNDGGGRLETVTAASGRSLVFSWSGGHVATVTDPLGRETHYDYDGAGDLVDVTDPAGRDTHFSYDNAHRMLSMRFPDQAPGEPGATGAAVSNSYDGQGRIIAQTDPMGRTTTFAYDGDPLSGGGGTTKVTDPKGNMTLQTYRFGELVSEQRGYETSQEATWSFAYDPSTLGMTWIADPLGHSTSNTFDSEGNLLTTTDPLGNTTTYTYDAENNRTSETDPRGTTTSYRFDGDGQLLEEATPLGGGGGEARTVFGYDAGPGEITKVTDADGSLTRIDYNGAGDRIGLVDTDGNETTYAHDADGELITTVAPAGNVAGADAAAHTTHYSYGPAGELSGETDPLGHLTSYEYDANGNRTAIIDADGHTTRQVFDADDELTEVIRPDGSVLATNWDANGNMIGQVDAAGHATRYAYDELDRLTAVTDPAGHATSYAYDQAGNRSQMTDPEGETTYYGYDAEDRLTSTYYSDGSTAAIIQGYDENGNRVELRDGSGTSTFSYDRLNRMTSAVDGAGRTIGYEYDPVGNLTKLTYPNGGSVSRAFDPAGHLTAVTDWLGHTTHFDYNPDLQLRELAYPNGVVAALEHDDADRLRAITDTGAAGQLAAFSYSRDPVGDVTGEEAANGEATTSDYRRDPLDQLTAADGTPYGYDAADNPTSFGAETTQQFDAANQLTASTGPGSIPEEPGEGSEPPDGPGGGSGEAPGAGPGAGGQSGPPRKEEPGKAPPAVPPALDLAVSAKAHKPGELTVPVAHGAARGDLVLAFIAAAGRGQRVTRVSGGGMRWGPVARGSGENGAAEVWQARIGPRLDGPVAIELRGKSRLATATIAAFAGARVVSQAVDHGRHSVPAAHIEPGAAQVWSVGQSSGQPAPVVAAKGQRIVSQLFSKRAGSAGWVQSTTRPGGSARPADTAAAGRWSLVSVAVAASTAAGDSAQASASGASAPMSSTASRVPALSAAAPRPAASFSRVAAPRSAATPANTILTRQFSYDQRGDRTAEAISGGPTRTLVYDLAGRLTRIAAGVEYAYDGDGLRVHKSVAGAVTGFAWDRSSPLPQLLGSGSRYYVYGPGGEPIEQIDGSTAIYLHEDQQGSVRLLTDAAGSVVGRYDYGPWGAVENHSGAGSDLQFDGQYTDTETGFQYLRTRYYDPATGQFLAPDPLAIQTRSRFGFAGNDPVDRVDPLGLWSLNLCVVACVGYQTGSGWGAGLGLGATVQAGAVAVGGGGSAIAYPHVNQVSLSGGKGALGGDIDIRDGQISVAQVCIGVGLLAICRPPDAGGSNSTYRAPNPMPWLQNAHNQYSKQYLRQSGSLTTPCPGAIF